jgi:hypothetical protein
MNEYRTEKIKHSLKQPRPLRVEYPTPQLIQRQTNL